MFENNLSIVLSHVMKKDRNKHFFLNQTLVTAISSYDQQVVSNSIAFLLFASDY